MYVLRFSNSAAKVLKKWKKSNHSVFKKAEQILSELIIHDDIIEVFVIEIEGHYDDK